MQTFYDKVFLERAEADLRFDYAAIKKSVPANSGKTVTWNRFTPLAAATTALTELTYPSAADISSATVTASVAEYGNYSIVGGLFDLTSIDVNLKEHSEVMGQNAGESIDNLIAIALSGNGTTQLAGAKTNITAVGTTDVFKGSEVRKAIRTLKINKAKTFAGGLYRGVITPYAAYDLRGDSEWLDAGRYTDTTNIKNGTLGKLAGVEFVETNNVITSRASTATVYSAYIFGNYSLGIVDIAGTSAPKIYVKMPNSGSTSNPLDLYSTVGWKSIFAAKVLNANWIIDVQHGATA